MAAAVAFVTFQSYQNGTHGNLGNRTGSNGTTTGCVTCHGNSSAATAVSLRLLKDGSPVASYTPGETYDVELTATNANANPKFGFQLTCGTATPSSTTLGTFDNSGISGTALRMSDRLVEHTTPLDGEVSGGSATYQRTFKWIAPAAGAGAVKFYAVVNGVNGNGQEEPGDNWNLGASEVVSETPVAGVNDLKAALPVKVYPNPAQHTLRIELGNKGLEGYSVSVTDVTGKTMLSTLIHSAEPVKVLDIAELPAGYYNLHLHKGTQMFKAHFIKH